MSVSPQPSQPPQFSWVNCGIASGIVNFIVNFLIGWFLAKPPVVIWGPASLASELFGTAFGVGFVTSLIVTPQTRGAILKGKLLGPPLSGRVYAHFANWPRLGIARAFMLGFAAVLVFIPIPLLCLYLLEPPALDRLDLAILKALFAAFVGALITPVIAGAAIVQANERQLAAQTASAGEPVPTDSELAQHRSVAPPVGPANE